jgi:sugar lactone lactonase YvrE
VPSPHLTPVVDGLGYPESPRWHNGRIWCTDFLARTVQSFGADGSRAVHGYLPGQPSGLGFGTDGQMLVVSVYDRKLILFENDSPRIAADIAPYANSPLNDMAVSESGTAYVGVLGLETAYLPHTEIGSGRVVAVSAHGECRIAATDLGVPNGIAITPDGRHLIVAETRGRRLTEFRIADDGSLVDRCEFADCGDRMPDGITIDAAGAVWMGCPFSSEFVRVERGGRVLETIPVPGKWAIACVFGGPDLDQLWCATAQTTRDELFRGKAAGFLEVCAPATPGAPSAGPGVIIEA